MSHRLQVLIPEALDARIRQAAKRTRVSMGERVRRAIERALEEQKTASDALEKLAALDAPTGDIEHVLGEIEDGRR